MIRFRSPLRKNCEPWPLMTDIETFERLLKARFPFVEVVIDQPKSPYGEWFIDIQIRGFTLDSVAYREDFGFGFYDEPCQYGDRPSRIIQDPFEAADFLIGRGPHLTLS